MGIRPTQTTVGDDRATPPSGGTGVGIYTPWYQDKHVWVALSVGAGLLTFVILVITTVCVYRKCSRRRKSWSTEWDEKNRILESKSAPISRNPSPRPNKRKSCPDPSPDFRNVVIRSFTFDGVPDFSLPPERIQPRTTSDGVPTPTQLHTQHSFVGQVQPDLYRCPSYSDEEALYLPPSQQGRLWFSVLYDAAVEQLTVTLVKVRELPGRGRDNAPRDPFVKIFLLPEERTCKTSKVRRKTLAPVYNESFTFQVSPDLVVSRLLRFSVYDVDKRRVRHSLGHILVPLRDLDLTKGDTLHKDLELSSQGYASLGELNLSLTYQPSIEKVKIVIIKARNLRQIEIDQDKSLFVRLQMLHGRKICKTKQTMQQRSTTEPIFNESFSFSLSGKVIDTCSFEISLITTTKTPFSHEEIYGKMVLGSFMFARGDELLHWQEMINHPKSSIVRWHPLSSTTHQN